MLSSIKTLISWVLNQVQLATHTCSPNSIKLLKNEAEGLIKIEATLEWNEAQTNLLHEIKHKNPKYFLNWPIIKKTMFHSPDVAEFLTLKKSSQWNHWRKIISEDSIGAPQRYLRYPKSSGNLIHHAYSLYLFFLNTSIDINKVNSVFEFGGGYGSFCRLLFASGFRGHYLIYDLPAFSILQKFYLTNIRNPLIIQDTIPPSLEPCTVSLLNNFDATNSNLISCDIFVALWSLSECPVELRDNVFRHISPPQFFLIAYQRTFSGIDNEDYFFKLHLAYSQYDWIRIPIGHLPDSYYLFGQRNPVEFSSKN